MATERLNTTVTVVEKYREYYKTNKYLAGIIKVDQSYSIQKAGQEVHITYSYPDEYDRIIINGIEYTPADNLGGDK